MRTARNCIRHNLTNYEQLWERINRGWTGAPAYQILRTRVEALLFLTAFALGSGQIDGHKPTSSETALSSY
jgi:hypothetical protein